MGNLGPVPVYNKLRTECCFCFSVSVESPPGSWIGITESVYSAQREMDPGKNFPPRRLVSIIQSFDDLAGNRADQRFEGDQLQERELHPLVTCFGSGSGLCYKYWTVDIFDLILSEMT